MLQWRVVSVSIVVLVVTVLPVLGGFLGFDGRLGFTW
jgi:hypothetical protein